MRSAKRRILLHVSRVVDQRCNGRALLERVPQLHDTQQIIRIERLQSDVFNQLVDAIREPQGHHEAERTAPACLVTEGLGSGTSSLLISNCFTSAEIASRSPLPAVDVPDSLQTLRSSPHLVDLDLQVRVIGSKEAEDNPLEGGAGRLLLEVMSKLSNNIRNRGGSTFTDVGSKAWLLSAART